MDIEELRRWIRAAVVAVPLTTSIGCGSTAPEPGPTEPGSGASSTSGAETGETGSSSASSSGTATRPQDGTMDPEEFDRQWRESLRQPPPEEIPVVIEGRPLITAHGASLGAVRAGADWSGTHAISRVDPRLAEALAAAWIEVGRAEHASVASFARATLELMAVGAPAELVEAHQRASLDEIAHARVAFALAAAHGAVVTPGALDVPGPRAPSLARLACDVFVEGCVNETASALATARAARSAIDPEVRAMLERIADDEAGHAALAWRTVRWALEEGGEPVRVALLAIEAPAVRETRPRVDAARLAAHGIVDAHGQACALREAWASIVAPLRAELLG